MMDEAPTLHRLKDLAVLYDGDGEYRPVGEIYNPFGLSAWFGCEGMTVVFTSKRFLITGPLVVRALKLSGYLDAEARQRLIAANDDDGTGGAAGAYTYGAGRTTAAWSSQTVSAGPDADGPSVLAAIKQALWLFFAGKPFQRVGAAVLLVQQGERFRLERKV